MIGKLYILSFQLLALTVILAHSIVPHQHVSFEQCQAHSSADISYWAHCQNPEGDNSPWENQPPKEGYLPSTHFYKFDSKSLHQSTKNTEQLGFFKFPRIHFTSFNLSEVVSQFRYIDLRDYFPIETFQFRGPPIRS